MASAIYPNGLKHIALGDVAWKAGGATIKATLIDTADYTYNAAHKYMNTGTVPAIAKEETETVTVIDATSGGVCDAVDTVFAAAAGDPTEAVIVWVDGGDGGTTAAGTVSFLLAYLEASVILNGGSVTAVWPGGGIFSLS